MARRKIKAGSTSQILPLFIQDTSSSTGAGLGSLVYNTASLAAKYRRQGDSSWTAITLVTATAGTFTSGGFVADGGSVTGGYELGLPNAMLAAGATWAQLQIYGATNMLAVLVEFELDAVDYQDTVRFGLTALPNVASGSAGGLIVQGTGTTGLDVSSGKVLLQATQTGVTIPTVTTVGTLTTYTGNTPQTGDSFARIGAPVNASISADVAAVKTDTGNLVTRITSTLFSGITQLSKWLGALAGKTADASTLTEIQATTAGAGYNNTTDSQEALRDRGDAAWTTATSVTVSDKTGFSLASGGLAAVTAWTVNVTGSLSGSVGSVTGAVGSVTGNVGGNVTGSVGSIATGGIVAGSFALDSITSTALAASAVSEIQSGLSTYAGGDTSGTTTLLSRLTATRAGYIDNLSGGAVMLASSYSAPPSAATISTQVASDLAAAHGAGTWTTATGFSTLDAAGVRNAVGLATANLDTQLDALPTAAEVSTQVQTDLGTGSALTSLASQSSVNTLTAYVDTEVAAILDAVATTGVVLSAAQMNKIADHVLRRTMANVEASSSGDTISLSSQYGAIQQIQESAVSGTTLTVNKTDGTTALGTKTVTTASGADAITGVS